MAAAGVFARTGSAQVIFSDGFEIGNPCGWSSVNTRELCFDGIDQDCDGAVDLDDPECAETLCESCESNDDCLAPSDICLILDDGLFCGQDCSGDNPYGTPVSECPNGYSCYDPGGGLASQCVPNTNACLCDGTNLSLRLACTITMGETTCEGERMCTVSGWSDCILQDEQGELCANGIDDDCDGSVDCDDVGCQGSWPCFYDGQSCSASDECLSSHCQNGFCCDSGDCCSEPGDCPGPYAPPPTCFSTATCQGFRYDATCSSSMCGTAPIPDDSACGPSTLAKTCGYYADVYCDGTSDQTEPTCLTICLYSSQCDPTAVCDSNVCVPKLANGEVCMTGFDCASSFCVDGVCCNSSCDGLCMSCMGSSTGGADGTCEPIASGTDPDDECEMGACDGFGGCAPEE